MNEAFSCPHCGKTHRRTARFCPSTGRLIGETNQQDSTVGKHLETTPEISRGMTGKLPQDAVINNRFRILRKIGKGGMAAVYQAADIRLPGKIWAVKEMSEAWITEPAERLRAVQAFQQEALILARLTHPNLPQVIDTFSEAGKQYLVMEFIHGRTLENILNDRPIPFTEVEVMPWALQLSDVLHYLHTQPKPIIFRDLKPSNIMIDENGLVKLIDFGIVRFFKPGQTKDTMAFGTQGYCAVEALSGQTDARSDLYSLCVVLHELLTAHNPVTTMFRLPPIRQLNPNISEDWERIIHRGLQTDRNQRWPDLKTFADALSQVQPDQRAVVQVPATIASPISDEQEMVRAQYQPARKTSRPTVRLVEAMNRLSAKQLAAAVGLSLVLVIAGLWFLTPVLVNYRFIWNNIPIISLVAPFVYAAIAHACFAVAGGVTIYFRLEMVDNYLLRLFLGAMISAIFIEIWLRNLDRIKGNLVEEGWKRELAWFCGMSVLATAFLYQITFERGMNILLWVGALLMAVLGWFLGDMLKEYLKLRQLG